MGPHRARERAGSTGPRRALCPPLCLLHRSPRLGALGLVCAKRRPSALPIHLHPGLTPSLCVCQQPSSRGCEGPTLHSVASIPIILQAGGVCRPVVTARWRCQRQMETLLGLN